MNFTLVLNKYLGYNVYNYSYYDGSYNPWNIGDWNIDPVTNQTQYLYYNNLTLDSSEEPVGLYDFCSLSVTTPGCIPYNQALIFTDT